METFNVNDAILDWGKAYCISILFGREVIRY